MPCVAFFSSSRIATTRALIFFRSCLSLGLSDEGGFDEFLELVACLSVRWRNCSHNSSISAFASLRSEATGGGLLKFRGFLSAHNKQDEVLE